MSGSVQKIFELLKQNHLTAKQVSQDTGISASNFTEWKKGRNEPGIQTIKILADYFNVSADYLLGNEEVSQNNVVNSGSSNTIQNGNNNVIELRAEGALTINNPAVAEAYESLTEREKLSVQMFILDTAEAKKKEKEKKD